MNDIAHTIANTRPVTCFDDDARMVDRPASQAQANLLMRRIKTHCYTFDASHYGFQARADMLLRWVVGRPLPNVDIYGLLRYVTTREMSNAINLYTYAWGEGSAWAQASDDVRKQVWSLYCD